MAMILGIGAISSTASIVRIVVVVNGNNADFLYGTTDAAIWSLVEAGTGILAGSIATLRPLFRLVLGTLGLTSRGTPGSNNFDRDGCYRSGVTHRMDDLRLNSHSRTITTIQFSKDGDIAKKDKQHTANGGSEEDLKPIIYKTFEVSTEVSENYGTNA